MRTLRENIMEDEMPFRGEPVMKQFIYCAESTSEYTAQLLSCINKTGYLCAFERIEHDPLMCGWLMELNSQGFGILLDSYQEYICEEAGGENHFQAHVCKAETKVEFQEVFSLWYKAMDINLANVSSLKGWNALVYLHDNAGELIRGARIYDADKKQIGRFALFRDKDNEPYIYYLNAANGHETIMTSCAPEIEDQVLEHLEKTIEVNRKNGCTIEEIDPEDDDFLEGNE